MLGPPTVNRIAPSRALNISDSPLLKQNATTSPPEPTRFVLNRTALITRTPGTFVSSASPLQSSPLFFSFADEDFPARRCIDFTFSDESFFESLLWTQTCIVFLLKNLASFYCIIKRTHAHTELIRTHNTNFYVCLYIQYATLCIRKATSVSFAIQNSNRQRKLLRVWLRYYLSRLDRDEYREKTRLSVIFVSDFTNSYNSWWITICKRFEATYLNRSICVIYLFRIWTMILCFELTILASLDYNF